MKVTTVNYVVPQLIAVTLYNMCHADNIYFVLAITFCKDVM